MFRNLDFILICETEEWIGFKKLFDPIYIAFSMIDKGYYAFQLSDDNTKKFLAIQPDEHKAIHEFMKEKGWIK